MVAVGLGGRRRLRREERDDVGAEEEDGEAQEHELHAVHGGCAAQLCSVLANTRTNISNNKQNRRLYKPNIFLVIIF